MKNFLDKKLIYKKIMFIIICMVLLQGCKSIKVPKSTSYFAKVFMTIGVNLNNNLRNEIFNAQSRKQKTPESYFNKYPYEPEIIINTREFSIIYDKNLHNKNVAIENRKLAIVVVGGAFYHGLNKLKKNMYIDIVNKSRLNFDIIFINYTSLYYKNYPYQLNEINEAYSYVRKLGYLPKNIFMIGDSAGGNLILASNLRWRDRGVKMPAMLVLLSPWTDLTNTVPSRIYNRKRDVVMGEINNKYPNAYLHNAYGENKKRNPYVSPIYGNFKNFPETVFELGSYEMLYDDSYKIYRNMLKNKVDVKFYATLGMFHVFQLVPVFPESQESRARIGRYLYEKFSK